MAVTIPAATWPWTIPNETLETMAPAKTPKCRPIILNSKPLKVISSTNGATKIANTANGNILTKVTSPLNANCSCPSMGICLASKLNNTIGVVLLLVTK